MLHIKGLEKVSLLDYDNKVSATIFLGGCNYKCPFCHNAPLVFNIDETEDLIEEDIFSYLNKRKGILDAVVVTGGEPTLYKELPEFLKRIKDLGYLVKLDSNGTNPEMLKYLIDNHLVDYIAMDIKNSEEKYDLTTGSHVDINKIKESINILMTSGIDYEFRTTLVNEYHTVKDIEKIMDLIRGAKRYYLQKFVERETCIVMGLHEVSEVDVKKMIEIAKKHIEVVESRGY